MKTSAAEKIGEVPEDPPPQSTSTESKDDPLTLDLDKEALRAKAEEKAQLADVKWDWWFEMVLSKITRANEDPKGKAAKPPPLEVADVRPYERNPQLSDNTNESAKKQWDFKESRLKKAREAQAQAAVTLQTEQNREEAELYRDTLRPSSLEAEAVNAKYGGDLEASLVMARTGLEMFTKGRTDYKIVDLKFQKEFREVTSVAVDLVNNMSLADFPQAKTAVLREAGIVAHKCSGQHLFVPYELGPPTAPLPPTGPPHWIWSQMWRRNLCRPRAASSRRLCLR